MLASPADGKVLMVVGVTADLVTRDAELGLAWLRVRNPPANLVFVDLANAGKVVDFLSNDNNRAEQKRNSAFIAAQHKAVAALLKQYKIK